MGHKGGYWQVHEECIVLTAVCQKVHVRLKQRQTVKKSSLQPYLLSSYTCLKATVSQLLSQSLENSIQYFFKFHSNLLKAF